MKFSRTENIVQRVTMYFRKPSASFFSIENLFNTVITSFTKTKVLPLYLPYKSASNPIALLKNIVFSKKRQGEVNHITGEIYYIALALPGKKTILTIHDLESLYSPNKIKNYLLQLFWLYLPARKVKFITVVSEYSKKKLLSSVKINEDKVIVIPNCVSFIQNDFKPKHVIDKKEPVLLQVGTKQNKNLDNLISAIEGYTCKLIIIGKLSESQLAQIRIKKINYENYSQLSYQEVKELYYRCDIVTFISLFEGFGMPILEANALGRPVITSSISAMPEVAGGSALLVDPCDPVQIREAIVKLVEDDNYRNSLVEAGFQNVQRFKPEVVAARYEEVYNRIIQEDK